MGQVEARGLEEPEALAILVPWGWSTQESLERYPRVAAVSALITES